MEFQTQKNMEFKFIGFSGHYGGDEYERLFCKRLSSISNNLNLIRITVKRKGGLKSIFGLLKLIFFGYTVKGRLIRPLGIPIFTFNMTVILHHFDQKGSPFYTRLLENIDYLLLRILSKILKVKYITVSDYWSNWVKLKFKIDSFIIYNEIDVDKTNIKDREYLSKKYNLKRDSAWIFLGSNQPKKGGKLVIDYLNKNYQNIFENIVLILSGIRKGTESKSSVVIWIDSEDYFSFIKSCELVIANSQFEEGWCRVLHEAALLNVPIVGSGSGGMGELLELVNGKANYSLNEIVDIIFDTKKVSGSINKLSTLKNRSETNLANWLTSFNP